MELKSWLSAPFKFAPIPVSVLAVLLYGVVFASVLVTDQTPAVAKDLGGLNLNQAYDDLHRVSASRLHEPRFECLDLPCSTASLQRVSCYAPHPSIPDPYVQYLETRRCYVVSAWLRKWSSDESCEI